MNAIDLISVTQNDGSFEVLSKFHKIQGPGLTRHFRWRKVVDCLARQICKVCYLPCKYLQKVGDLPTSRTDWLRYPSTPDAAFV